jgi:hypothetical protein
MEIAGPSRTLAQPDLTSTLSIRDTLEFWSLACRIDDTNSPKISTRNCILQSQLVEAMNSVYSIILPSFLESPFCNVDERKHAVVIAANTPFQ